ncbi:amino acid adenylation domain-containing protein [Bacillus seohaeanensis]|uniref:Amino acid adenylation domain-containing protein n=1 Tax=Bacillus seohaeanensis TaxID=284580 RepID=A0ABW5RM18_9BACI
MLNNTDYLSKNAYLEKKLAMVKSKKDGDKSSKKYKGLKESRLSLSQKRLWFLNKLYPESSAYNIPEAVQLVGALDIKKLEKSINTIIKRHEILRTEYIDDGEEPRQRVKDFCYKKIRKIDLGKFPYQDREWLAMELIKRQAAKPFKLTKDSLFTYRLYCIHESCHILFLNFHHSIYDGWSSGLFWKELCALYNSNGEEDLLPKLEIQFTGFAEWEQEEVMKPYMRDQLQFWRETLHNAEVLDITADKRRDTTEERNRGNIVEGFLPEKLRADILRLCHDNEVTVYMFLLTVYKILLHKYTGKADLIVGSPIAGRKNKEFESLIGFFVNTLPIRTKLDCKQSFLNLLGQVKETVLKAMDNQDIPFDKIVNELKPDRDVGINPFFQTTFTYQPEGEGIALKGLEMSNLEINNYTSKFDLSLFAIDTSNNGLKVVTEYNDSLFHQSTIERFTDHFITLLRRIVEQPTTAIHKLSILTNLEKKQLLNEWNKNEVHYDPTDYIHKMFEQCVQNNPKRTALLVNGNEYTYQEINNEANKIANYLKKIGVKNGDFIGINIKRSKELIVSILGVLKAGGAYIPLDPSYPQDRIHYMLDKSNLNYLITQTPEQFKSETIRKIDLREVENESTEFIDDSNHVTSGNDAAYMIFTSGSTGKPKGVVIEHKGLCNLVHAQKEIFTVKEEDRILQFASMSFDASVWEIFMGLANGATLCLMPEDFDNLDIDFISFLTVNKITIGTFPASFLANINPEDVPELKKVIVAGERCPINVAKEWSKHKEFWNAYGPSETTVCATVHKYHNEEIIPIGRPIPNSEVYVLDEQMELVPVGVPGELYIGGIGLAREYFNDPVLTNKKFVKNPFKEGNERLYKSGDRVKYLPDGTIDFLDRIDNQVKIRGFRVELGEIENALLEIEGVSKAVVDLKTMENKHSKLVAYITLHKEKIISREGILSQLKDQLPGYMIPASIIELEQFPYTPNGKVDRKRLPAPETIIKVSRSDNDSISPVQSKLKDIWEEVLNKESIHIEDNFFELGGDSLLILKIISRAKERGLFFTPRVLYQNPTIKRLSEYVKENEEINSQHSSLEGEFSLSPIQEWFFERNLTDEHHWNFSMLFSVSSQVDTDIVKQAVNRLYSYHDALRLNFKKVDGQVKQYYGDESYEMPFDIIEVGKDEDISTEINRIGSIYQSSLDVKSNLIRAVFIKTEGKENKLLLVIHHLVTDWISGGIIFEDLSQIIQSLSVGEEIKLPAKTHSFKGWIERLEEYSKRPDLLNETEFWLTVHTSNQPRIPLDFSKGENIRNSVDEISIVLDRETTKRLLHVGLEELNSKLDKVLLACVIKAVMEWSNQTSVLIDIDSHGREDIFNNMDISRTVGWFTNLYPFLYTGREDKSIEDTVYSVGERMEEIPNNGLGYGVLRYLNDSIKFNHLDSEILFNFFGNGNHYSENRNDSSQSLVEMAEEFAGSLNSSKQERAHKFEVLGVIKNGELIVSWHYSRHLHKRETVEELIGKVKSYLEGIVLSHVN